MNSDLQCAHAELQKSFSSSSSSSLPTSTDIKEHVEEFTKKRLERQNNFLRYLEQQKNDQIAEYLKDNMSREE